MDPTPDHDCVFAPLCSAGRPSDQCGARRREPAGACVYYRGIYGVDGRYIQPPIARTDYAEQLPLFSDVEAEARPCAK